MNLIATLSGTVTCDYFTTSSDGNANASLWVCWLSCPQIFQANNIILVPTHYMKLCLIRNVTISVYLRSTTKIFWNFASGSTSFDKHKRSNPNGNEATECICSSFVILLSWMFALTSQCLLLLTLTGWSSLYPI